MPTPTLLWYDYETTGTDPARDRPVQFAAQRTNLDLQPVAAPVTFYCKPSHDILPQPEACLITGIAPQVADHRGLIEVDFARAVHELMAAPGTCSAGYNTIRFDDEVNRNLFYRNFFDPYAHTWQHGNARWDILDLARACYALRPAGIEWPTREDGTPSFKLEHLARANCLEQAHAHDAHSDVGATIALARLLRDRQPRLYDWCFKLRSKAFAASQVNARLPDMQPLLHVSGRYPPARGCLAMVAPLTESPGKPDKFIVADLDVDPAAWARLPAADLAERLFTRRADLPADLARPPLKEVHANKSPFLAPLDTLRGVDTRRIALDPERCLRHRDALAHVDGLRERVREAFASRDAAWPAQRDPELALYAGFPSAADRHRCEQVRTTPPAQLASTNFNFDAARYTELLFRYRARNWPDTLGTDERARWQHAVRDKLTREGETTTLTLEQYAATLARLRGARPPGPQQALLDQLQAWAETLRTEWEL